MILRNRIHCLGHERLTIWAIRLTDMNLDDQGRFNNSTRIFLNFQMIIEMDFLIVLAFTSLASDVLCAARVLLNKASRELISSENSKKLKILLRLTGFLLRRESNE